jgi:hypothetical protein
MLKVVFGICFSVLSLLHGAAVSAAEVKTENVFLITLDGFRWQEVFTGAEEALISKAAGGVSDTNQLRKAFWRESPQERRSALLPFFWDVIAQQGQLLGNQQLGSMVKVTNGKNFTYPGFNEILAGFADDRITKNAKIQNSNVTVLEWLHRLPAFTNKIAAFANWDVFPFILNSERAGIPIWTGYPEGTLKEHGPGMAKVRALAEEITPVWDGMNFDVFFYEAALEYVRQSAPRVVWIAFSETDEWAHEGRYDLYLHAAHRIDRYIKGLWDAVQSMPQYRAKTAFILTTDHGRGPGLRNWKDHGADVPGAEGIWIAALGPDITGAGERKNIAPSGQNQIAATIATWLGLDYESAVSRAGKAIPELIPPIRK